MSYYLSPHNACTHPPTQPQTNTYTSCLCQHHPRWWERVLLLPAAPTQCRVHCSAVCFAQCAAAGVGEVSCHCGSAWSASLAPPRPITLSCPNHKSSHQHCACAAPMHNIVKYAARVNHTPQPVCMIHTCSHTFVVSKQMVLSVVTAAAFQTWQYRRKPSSRQQPHKTPQKHQPQTGNH